MSQRLPAVTLVTGLAFSLLLPSRSHCFTYVIEPTLHSVMKAADAVVVAKYVRPSPSKPKSYSEYEVVQVIKGEHLTMRPQIIEAVAWNKLSTAETFILVGEGSPDLVWSYQSSSSDALCRYLTEMAQLPKDSSEQLNFFLRQVESTCDRVSSDATRVLSRKPLTALMRLRSEANLDRIRTHLRRYADLNENQQSLYMGLLGIWGTVDDAILMEKIVPTLKQDENSDNMAEWEAWLNHYLQLRGEEGLSFFEENVLQELSFAQLFGATMALRGFCERSHQSKPRVLQTVHQVLDCEPRLTRLTLSLLADLEDWTQLDKAYKLFVESKDSESVREAAIHYLARCPLDKAEAYIAELKKIDEKSVRDGLGH